MPVLVIERHHPVVEDLGGGDRGLAIIQFCKDDLGIGVDHRLLIDPADTLQGADIESILDSSLEANGIRSPGEAEFGWPS